MSDSMGSAQDRVIGLADMAVGQAMQGSVGAFAVLIILVFTGLVALWIWRRTAVVESAETRERGADCHQPSCPDMTRVLSETRHMSERLQEAAADRRSFQDRTDAALVRLHERIDDQAGQFATHGELAHVKTLFGHFDEEVSRLVELLRDKKER